MHLIRSSQTRTSTTSTFPSCLATEQKFRGVHNLAQHHRANCRRRCLSPASTIALVVNENGYNLFSRTVHQAALWESRPDAEVCDECWLMGYRVRHPIHPPHPAHSVFHSQQVHATHVCLSLRLRYTMVKLSPIQISPQCNERISIAKPNAKCISLVNLGIFVVAIVLVTSPSLITALHLSVLPRTLGAESPLNDHNNRSYIKAKTS
jgi:hypothetical protein